jgi:DNA repair protein RecO (recombination protein O)
VNSRFVKTEAIVLNSVQFGEGHKIVKLLTDNHGKIEASAFGARKVKSRFGSKLEPFTIVNLLLYRKNEESIYSIREADAKYHCVSIRNNFSKFVVASSLIEPVLNYVERAQSDPKLYKLLSDSLTALDRLVPEKGGFLLSMFDIKFHSIQGYSPDINVCNRCGRELDENQSFSDYNNGFPLCKMCKTGASTSVIKGAYQFFKWAKNNSIDNAKKVKMEDSTLANVREIIEHLYLYTFHSTPKSWKQLKECFPSQRYI